MDIGTLDIFFEQVASALASMVETPKERGELFLRFSESPASRKRWISENIHEAIRTVIDHEFVLATNTSALVHDRSFVQVIEDRFMTKLADQ
jgi:uncharacterized Fe-S cluster-containing radical SAM superfamily protein